jgi:hypothetical protein
MAQQGYREVIAIATEPIPSVWERMPIHIIRPSIDPALLGADFTDITDEGLVAGHEHGLERGRAFVEE